MYEVTTIGGLVPRSDDARVMLERVAMRGLADIVGTRGRDVAIGAVGGLALGFLVGALVFRR